MGEQLRALIVEDSESDALLLLRELKNVGFELQFERVETKQQFVDALENGSWDIVLSDYNLPNFDAPKALNELQRTNIDIPFIVISGTVGEEIAVQTMKAGAHDYIIKGSLTRLGEAIRREMRDAQVRRENKQNVEQIRHLNQILRAIRNVNQLIVREQNPEKLAKQACQELVSTRGYDTAWISLSNENQCETKMFQAGFSENLCCMEDQHNNGHVPLCCQRALETDGAIAIQDPSCTCDGCMHDDDCKVIGNAQGTTLAVALRMSDKVYGFLCVSIPASIHVSDEELSLLNEVAGDVAFALHGISLRAAGRRTEAALQVSEWKYKDLIENMSELVQSISPEGQLLFANKAWLDKLGYSEKEVYGMSLFNIIHEDSLKHCKDVFQRVLSERKIRNIEAKFITKDGVTILVEGSVTCRFEKGQPVSTYGIFRDVTEQKQVQANLAQSDRLASMGMLAAGVAHEINNPLSYVLFNLESLSEDLPRFSKAMHHCMDTILQELGDERWNQLIGKEQEWLNPVMLTDISDRFTDALDGIYRIKDIARGLGSFSRVDKDRLVPVNITHVIEVAVNLAFNEIKYRALLIKEYGKTDIIMANDGRLSQVFLNLLVNAAHAIEEGDAEGNEIHVRTWQEGSEVFAEIRDSGKGIAEEHLPKLFEPFFTTKEIGFGTGLGLPISKNIIDGYGGHIDVKSEIGKGTSFIVRLPVQSVSETSNEPTKQTTSVQQSVHGRIMVIDDEDGIRAAIRRILKDHEVVEASSGEAGKEIFKSDQNFDLILCDMMMPAISGVDLHHWLVNTYPVLADRIVFITGGAFTPKAREYLSKINNIHVEKPFDATNLKKIVAELILASRSK